MLGAVGNRKQRIELHAGEDGVDHSVFGAAGVDAPAGDLYFGRGGVEALVLKFAEFASVDCVGLFGAKNLRVEILCPPSDFLVGGERSADRAVRQFRMRGVVGEEVHDLGDPGLVIGAQECRAVRDDQVLADVGEELGEIGGTHDDRRGGVLFVEDYVLTPVILDDAGIDALAGACGRGVHVRDEADGGFCSREFGIDIAVLSVINRLYAHLTELLIEEPRQVVLFGGGGLGGNFFGRLGVDLYIAEKPVNECGVCDHKVSPECYYSKPMQMRGRADASLQAAGMRRCGSRSGPLKGDQTERFCNTYDSTEAVLSVILYVTIKRDYHCVQRGFL